MARRCHMGPKILRKRVHHGGGCIQLGMYRPSQWGNLVLCQILGDKMKSCGGSIEERWWIRLWCGYQIYNPGKMQYVADGIPDGDRFCGRDCSGSLPWAKTTIGSGGKTAAIIWGGCVKRRRQRQGRRQRRSEKWGKLYDTVQWMELVQGMNLPAYLKYKKIL